MIIISGFIGILLIILLAIRIAQATGGTKTTITTMQGTFDERGNFHPGQPPPTPLPLSGDEFERQAASMPVEWVTYAGMTPPLNLKIRGTTEIMFRQTSRKYINMIGQEKFEQLSSGERDSFMHAIMAEAYVLDWSGALYPNGNAMPFSTSSLTVLLDKDPYLVSFLSDQAERMNPGWANR